MKPRKPGTLNAADKATITNIIRSECLPLNREHRKRLRELEKENKRLKAEMEDRNQKAYNDGYDAAYKENENESW